MSEEQFETLVRRYAEPIADRIQVNSNNPKHQIDVTHCGIYFVMALWSMPSTEIFKHVIDSVCKLDTDAQLQIVVADIDEISRSRDPLSVRDKVGGWGETLWIHQGEVVASSGPGIDLECIQSNTMALLKRQRTD